MSDNHDDNIPNGAILRDSSVPHVPIPGYVEAPTPYDEVRCKSDPMWYRDYYDDAIPSSKGFITDIIFHSRGYETPTLSVIWTAIFILSSAIKREAWMAWTPKHLFTNQYILIIGPAGVVKKTTAVTDIGYPILKKFRSYIRDPQLAEMKIVHMIQDKITPEAMICSMLPENKDGRSFALKDSNGEFVLGKNGKAVTYEKTSECAIVVSELSMLLSKAAYQAEMIQYLLDLYDARDEWHTETKGSGKSVLRNLHTTLFGATTVDGLRNSIPDSAKGDGFLSRTILVHVPDTRRQYMRPFIPKKAPSIDELAKRLAWIAEHTLGEYKFSPEAEALAESWYQYFSKKKRENPTLTSALSRMDVNVYKLSLLMRAQRYNCDDNIISKEDLQNAIKLMDYTYSSFSFLMSQISADDFVQASSTIGEWLSRRGKVTRARMLQATHVRYDIANYAINDLIQKGLIKATIDEQEISETRGATKECYEWLGGSDERPREVEDTGEDEDFNYTGSVFHIEADRQSARSVSDGSAKMAQGGGRKVAPKAKGEAVQNGPAKTRKAGDKSSASEVDGGTPGRKATPKRKGNS